MVERVFEPRLGQTKNYEIGIFCFSVMYAALRRKSSLARNQENESGWGETSICELLFQWVSTIAILIRIGLVKSGPCCVHNGEAKYTNFIVFGLTQSGLEHTFYRARLEASTQTITPPMRLNWNIWIEGYVDEKFEFYDLHLSDAL
jgi:hypothetical protein